MPMESSPSAGIEWLDLPRRLADLRLRARHLRQAMPSVSRVIRFGSLARGDAGPRSDADLLIVVSGPPHPRPPDRAAEVSRGLGRGSCPVDVFVLTEEEVDDARERGVVRVALETGLDLLT
ncbi:MAG: nucleotidyltransferase domain-containing protein [Planctomycetes bacterium]|jgi:predicted nucleotidyltransferase|nr:nucleotidyltransferase domain-containing protein [Planctomycetota bacterium]